MFNRRTIAALTAVAALTGSAAASAATPAPGGLGNATLGSVLQSEQQRSRPSPRCPPAAPEPQPTSRRLEAPATPRSARLALASATRRSAR